MMFHMMDSRSSGNIEAGSVDLPPHLGNAPAIAGPAPQSAPIAGPCGHAQQLSPKLGAGIA